MIDIFFEPRAADRDGQEPFAVSERVSLVEIARRDLFDSERLAWPPTPDDRAVLAGASPEFRSRAIEVDLVDREIQFLTDLEASVLEGEGREKALVLDDGNSAPDRDHPGLRQTRGRRVDHEDRCAQSDDPRRDSRR